MVGPAEVEGTEVVIHQLIAQTAVCAVCAHVHSTQLEMIYVGTCVSAEGIKSFEQCYQTKIGHCVKDLSIEVYK